MSLPASDTFGGSDGTTPPNGNWTNQNVGLRCITLGVGTASNGSYGFAFWNADVFGSDQYSEITIKSGSASVGGPCVRMDGSNNCYFMDCDDSGGSGSFLWLRSGGSLTNLNAGLGSITFATGDKAKIEVTGTGGSQQIKCYKDTGSGYVQVGSTINDATLSGGSAGIGSLVFTSPLTVLWGGGNVSSATNFPLNAASGSYSVTGIDDGAVIARSLPLVAGSYLETGAVATKDLGAAATASAYAINGPDANLHSNIATAYSVALDAGGYSADGVNFSNVVGTTIPAVAGSYAATGTDIGQSLGHGFNAALGTYAIFGRSAYLKGPHDPAFEAGGLYGESGISAQQQGDIGL